MEIKKLAPKITKGAAGQAVYSTYVITALVNCLAVKFSAHNTVMGSLVSLLKNGFVGHSI